MNSNLSSGNTIDTLPIAGRFHVVGIGASAGGLEALEALISALPTESGMAFIVQQHLSPDFESQMDSLLGRMTKLPVKTVEHRAVVVPDTIYVAPPRKEMILSQGTLLLTDRDPDQAFSLPIDRFFRSLAQDAVQYAVGVILSGTGSDGSRGIREIHDAGGLTIAQTPESARFDGMPKSAVATGCIDMTLEPSEMPHAIRTHVSNFGQTRLASGTVTIPDTGLREILRLLRAEYDIDFNHYKPNTVVRRIERRLKLSAASVDINDYADFLRTHPDELNSLYHDLLIGVTRFFRDPGAFETIRDKVLPHLINRFSGEREGWRIWVPGCATGEEAYSLAILFDLALEANSLSLPQVKIFATDVHRRSLEVASRGVYPPDVLHDIDEPLRTRYFRTDRDGNYRIVKPIRQSIVFAKHNVIKDAPFTRLHLVSCRNLLIYLQPNAQNKVLSLFHFGLHTEGCLLLGPSETPGELAKEFEAIDNRWKVYKKRRDIRLPTGSGLSLPGQHPGRLRRKERTAASLGQRLPDARTLATYDLLLGKFMPPSFLIDEDYHLVHSFGGAQRYLRLPGGRASSNVLDLIHPELKTAVSGALQRVDSSEKPVRFTGLRVTVEGEPEQIRLTVERVSSPRFDNADFLVCVEPLSQAPVEPEHDQQEVNAARISRDYLESLESELRFTKENLQATIEELETSNEELQATNEEMVAANEELQSTNEELHSVNEELHTINAEHQKQIEELTEITNDLDNLLNSIDVGVLFLDLELCVRKFTSSMARTFHLLPQDVGRRFDNFSHNIVYDTLIDDVESVREGGEIVEREVANRRGDLKFLRILPYRAEEEIDGIVLLLIDISRLKHVEAVVSHLSSIVEHSQDAIVSTDLDGRITSWNQGAERLYGYAEDEARGRHVSFLRVEGQQDDSEDALERLRQGEYVEEFEAMRRHKSGLKIPVEETISPVYDERGDITGASSITRDITQRKRVEHRLRRAVQQRERFLAMLSHELRNPLMAMLTASAIISEQKEPSARQRAADVVTRQVAHMARILDDLLDVSRMRQDRIEMRREPLDLRSILEDTLDEVRPRMESNNMQLTVTAPEEPLPLLGDKTRLCQLLVNLLTNAIKYTPAGKSVTLVIERDDDHAVIRVEDDGIGLEQSSLEDIFEPFVQDSRQLGDTQGMGLGLALVRAIAQAHGGDVKAYSDGPDRGSQFVVRLPMDAPPVDTVPRAPSVRTDGLHRVLLVEDQEDNRELLTMALEQHGYLVSAVGSANAAIEHIERTPPNTAIVDIGLPDQNGHAVARRARELYSRESILLIALTGYGQQKDRVALKEAGFDHHVVKPASVSMLRSLIEGED